MERFLLPLAGRDDRFWATSRLLCTIALNYNQMKCGSDHTSPYGARIFSRLSPYMLTCKPKVLHALEHSALEPSCVLETMNNSCSLVDFLSNCHCTYQPSGLLSQTFSFPYPPSPSASSAPQWYHSTTTLRSVNTELIDWATSLKHTCIAVNWVLFLLSWSDLRGQSTTQWLL